MARESTSFGFLRRIGARGRDPAARRKKQKIRYNRLMSRIRNLKKIFDRIQVVRPPRHKLSTFGSSQITYKLVTDVPGLPDRARLRTGLVTAERPGIITA